MPKKNLSLLNRLVFSEFLWCLTGIFAWPREAVAKRRMRFIFGDDCSASLEASESRLP